jgi:hypothetical protein
MIFGTISDSTVACVLLCIFASSRSCRRGVAASMTSAAIFASFLRLVGEGHLRQFLGLWDLHRCGE